MVSHSVYGDTAVAILQVEQRVGRARNAIQRQANTAVVDDAHTVHPAINGPVSVAVEHQAGAQAGKVGPHPIIGSIREQRGLVVLGIGVYGHDHTIARNIHFQPRRQVAQELIVGIGEPFHRPAKVGVALHEFGNHRAPILRGVDHGSGPLAGDQVAVRIALQEGDVRYFSQPGQRLGWPGTKGRQIAQNPNRIRRALSCYVGQDGFQRQKIAVHVG